MIAPEASTVGGCRWSSLSNAVDHAKPAISFSPRRAVNALADAFNATMMRSPSSSRAKIHTFAASFVKIVRNDPVRSAAC
ncbi:MAG: hypothetical protein DWI10_05445 [Planctomycetota bacterium]|nr:MAG: hypothetical protein DWI10_05445 [Planctomycetota bacterium]